MSLEVHFDEAGNTGAALLDTDQPVFVLASTDFTRAEAEELLGCVRTQQTKEVKFTALRRSEAGKRRLLNFLASPLLTPLRAKVSIAHKRYMAICKAVDIIEETLAHQSGLDLYERGANIAIANLHFCVTPVFCGQQHLDAFLAAFVQMVRTPDPEAKASFFAAVRALHDNCREPRYLSAFGPYLYAEAVIDDLLEGIDYTALDPAIGFVFNQLSHWGKQFGREFLAIHDVSKPVAGEQATFEAMMNPTAQPKLIGYDRRKFEFPLRFADSHDLPQLQVADLLAGAMAYFGSAVARSARDDLANQLEHVGIERFTIHAIWPSPDVTPQRLGTEEVGGINAANFMADALAKMRI